MIPSLYTFDTWLGRQIDRYTRIMGKRAFQALKLCAESLLAENLYVILVRLRRAMKTAPYIHYTTSQQQETRSSIPENFALAVSIHQTRLQKVKILQPFILTDHLRIVKPTALHCA